jgi:hypothetical protein
MKYRKPEVATLASAADAIQSSQIKEHQYTVENFGQYLPATTSAYEADE